MWKTNKFKVQSLKQTDFVAGWLSQFPEITWYLGFWSHIDLGLTGFPQKSRVFLFTGSVGQDFSPLLEALMFCVQKGLENAFHIWLVKVQDCVNCGWANSNCITVIVLWHLQTVGNFRLKRLGQTSWFPKLYLGRKLSAPLNVSAQTGKGSMMGFVSRNG